MIVETNTRFYYKEKKAKGQLRIARDHQKSDVYKSLFVSHISHKRNKAEGTVQVTVNFLTAEYL